MTPAIRATGLRRSFTERRSLAAWTARRARIYLTSATPGRPLRTEAACARNRSGSIFTRTRNISLSRSSLVSTVLGVNCACVGDERDLRRDRAIGHGVEHDPCVGADLDFSGLVGGKVNVHVDIFDVEHGEDLAACGQHLADIGDTVWMRPSRGATSELSAMLTL